MAVGNFTNTVSRLKEYVDYKGISINKFSISVGASNSYFNKAFQQNTSIGSNRIESILRTYPDLNAHWLLTGKGQMIIEEKEMQPIIMRPETSEPMPEVSTSTLAYLEKKINEKDTEINSLHKQIGRLELELEQSKVLLRQKELGDALNAGCADAG